jgi:hypothetical protein
MYAVDIARRIGRREHGHQSFMGVSGAISVETGASSPLTLIVGWPAEIVPTGHQQLG